MKSACYGIIPARYASTRLPGKPLADICGKPMIWHVAMRAMRCAALRGVWIATDDERIAEAARALGSALRHDGGGSSQRHGSRAPRRRTWLGLPQDAVVVNIQGDEPLLEPAMLDELLAPFADDGVQCATLATPLEPAADAALIASPNQVKVVTDLAGDALYFSRAPVPYPRDGTASRYLGHVGIYAFRRRVLERMSALPSSPLELLEKLEQLRLLENGIPMAGRRDFVPHLRRGHSGGSGGRPSRSCPSTRLISPEIATRNIIMSQLATARRQLSSIKSLIRQEKFPFRRSDLARRRDYGISRTAHEGGKRGIRAPDFRCLLPYRL